MKKIGKYLLALGMAAVVLPHSTFAESKAEGSDNKRQDYMLKRFDKNGDGTLDDTEKTAADKFRAEKRKQLLGKFDKDGDGKLNDSEKAAFQQHRNERKAEKLAKFDANKDGKLDKEERATAKASRKAEKKS
ncbi:MAG: hypothetical protein SGI71_03290 [Verrucomicrobiota bacterium]|nr:hypothetical protein [Verrucomicrobiota bacterium]